MKTPLVCVIFDGIENSVFKSQVLEPLKLNYSATHNITIISFERFIPDKQILHSLQLQAPEIKFILHKRFPIITPFSLIGPNFKLKRYLKKISGYKLIARGPIAGLICVPHHSKKNCKEIIIQSRGLLAAEYEYVNQSNNILKKLWHSFRFFDLLNLEKKVYALKKINQSENKLKIEAVSDALYQHLAHNFNTPQEYLVKAKHDIPKIIQPSQVIKWRSQIRQELNISEGTTVYCYNGSAKSWQCPEAILDYFYEQKTLKKFLFILSQDESFFKELLRKSNIAETQYLIKKVEHAEIYKYLSACDIGLIFRHSHLLNWISRPTKVLEYHAVGLKIIHNNTVKWLIDEF